LLAPPRITVDHVHREGSGCLGDYPARLKFRGVLIFLALVGVTTLSAAIASLARIGLVTIALTLAGHTILALVSASERALFRRWALMGALYRWSRQAPAECSVEALDMAAAWADSTNLRLWRLSALASTVWPAFGLLLCIAPRIASTIPCSVAIVVVVTCTAALVVAVRREERTLCDLLKTPTAAVRF